MIMFHIFVVAEILLHLQVSTVDLNVKKYKTQKKISKNRLNLSCFLYVLYGEGVVLYLLRNLLSNIWVIANHWTYLPQVVLLNYSQVSPEILTQGKNETKSTNQNKGNFEYLWLNLNGQRDVIQIGASKTAD